MNLIKKGTKVAFVNNNDMWPADEQRFTKGQIYEVAEDQTLTDPETLMVFDNNGSIGGFYSWRFEVRQTDLDSFSLAFERTKAAGKYKSLGRIEHIGGGTTLVFDSMRFDFDKDGKLATVESA